MKSQKNRFINDPSGQFPNIQKHVLLPISPLQERQKKEGLTVSVSVIFIKKQYDCIKKNREFVEF